MNIELKFRLKLVVSISRSDTAQLKKYNRNYWYQSQMKIINYFDKKIDRNRSQMEKEYCGSCL